MCCFIRRRCNVRCRISQCRALEEQSARGENVHLARRITEQADNAQGRAHNDLRGNM